MNIRASLLGLLGSPDRAWLGLMVGFVLIGRELTGPGRIIPGVLGAVTVLTSAWMLSEFRIAVPGLLILLVAVGLILLQGFRRWWFLPGIAGALLVPFGARNLLAPPWSISWPAAAVGFVIALIAAWLWYVAVRARRSKLSA